MRIRFISDGNGYIEVMSEDLLDRDSILDDMKHNNVVYDLASLPDESHTNHQTSSIRDDILLSFYWTQCSFTMKGILNE